MSVSLEGGIRQVKGHTSDKRIASFGLAAAAIDASESSETRRAVGEAVLPSSRILFVLSRPLAVSICLVRVFQVVNWSILGVESAPKSRFVQDNLDKQPSRYAAATPQVLLSCPTPRRLPHKAAPSGNKGQISSFAPQGSSLPAPMQTQGLRFLVLGVLGSSSGVKERGG